MSEFVTSTLKEMGAAGAAISVLLTAITGLTGGIIYLFRQNGKLNAERRAENAVLIKLVGDNTAALNKNADATGDRNKVTQNLADAISTQAAAFALVNERVGFYHEDNKEKLRDITAGLKAVHDVVGAGADALRVNTGMVTEVRNGNLSIQQVLQTIQQILSKRR